MPEVQAIVCKKKAAVRTIDPQATVLEASQLMNQHQIGALIVIEGGRVAGIFTERDVMRRIVVERRDPATVLVAEVMTRTVVTCRTHTKLATARKLFLERRVRHLPVMDAADQLVGMISIGDLNAWELDGQECKIAALEEVIYGMV